MKLASNYLHTLDAGRDHRAYAAFTRLLVELDAPLHVVDLRPILEWVSFQLDDFSDRLDRLERRQDPEHHNPVSDDAGTVTIAPVTT